MELSIENITQVSSDAWEYGKQYTTYILNYLEETKWVVPLDDVMNQ